MNGQRLSEESIFLEAIEQESAEERRTYLDRVCAHDPQLRQDVEDLLTAHDRLCQSPRSTPGPHAQTVAEAPAGEGLGEAIGPYQLREVLGEGGFGIIYRAEQQAPIRRTVALKLIKPGMDSRQILARFDAERQALALMARKELGSKRAASSFLSEGNCDWPGCWS
jgi:serine/threonine protein kinase